MSDLVISVGVVIALIIAYVIYILWIRKTPGTLIGAGSSLSVYTHDWTSDAQEGRLDPVIGRDEEIERVIHILMRRRKNNPLLIGDPGVGKTAIIEGLASRIASGNIPKPLLNKRVLALDLTGMVSGTKYRGELEERIQQLTKEIESFSRTVILFIDEMQVIEQTSGSEGSINVSDILKPALSRGALQAIGATTWEEYEKYIIPDRTLNRRFQPIIIGEPSKDETLKILRGIRKEYEEFHGVNILDEALEAAVELSKKIKNRFLPDKAIDLIDEACAKVAIEALGEHRIALGIVHSAAKKAKKRTKPAVKRDDIEEIVKEWEEVEK